MKLNRRWSLGTLLAVLTFIPIVGQILYPVVLKPLPLYDICCYYVTPVVSGCALILLVCYRLMIAFWSRDETSRDKADADLRGIVLACAVAFAVVFALYLLVSSYGVTGLEFPRIPPWR